MKKVHIALLTSLVMATGSVRTTLAQSGPETAASSLLADIEAQIASQRGANRADFATALSQIVSQEGATTTGLRARELLVAIQIDAGNYDEADATIESALQLPAVVSTASLKHSWLQKWVNVAKVRYDRESAFGGSIASDRLLRRYEDVISTLRPNVFLARDDGQAAESNLPAGYALLTQVISDRVILQVTSGLHAEAESNCDSAITELQRFREARNSDTPDLVEMQLQITRGAALIGLSRVDEAQQSLSRFDEAQRDIAALNMVTRAKRATKSDKARFGLAYLASQSLPFSPTEMSLALLVCEGGDPQQSLVLIDRLLSKENESGLDAIHRLRPARPNENAVNPAPSAEVKFAKYQLVVRKAQVLEELSQDAAARTLRQAIAQEFADSPSVLKASGLTP